MVGLGLHVITSESRPQPWAMQNPVSSYSPVLSIKKPWERLPALHSARPCLNPVSYSHGWKGNLLKWEWDGSSGSENHKGPETRKQFQVHSTDVLQVIPGRPGEEASDLQEQSKRIRRPQAARKHQHHWHWIKRESNGIRGSKFTTHSQRGIVEEATLNRFTQERSTTHDGLRRWKWGSGFH